MSQNYPQESYQNLLHDASKTLLRRWRLILSISIAMTFTIYFSLLFISSKYEASAKLMVKLGRENTEVPLTVNRGMVNSVGVQKEEINTYISLLTSRKLIETAVNRVGVERFIYEPPRPNEFFKIIKYYLKQVWKGFNEGFATALDGLGLQKKLSDHENVIKNLTKNLNVVQERDSNVILVTLRLSDSGLALDSLNAVLAVFFERHHELFHNTDLRVMFDGQTKSLLKELNGVQTEIDNVKTKWGIKSVTEQRNHLIERLYKIKHDLDDETTQFKMMQHMQTILGHTLKTLPSTNLDSETVQPNPRADQMRQRRTELQLERAHKGESFEPSADIIKSLDQEIATLNTLLAKEEAQQRGAKTFRRDALYDKFYVESEWGKVSLATMEVTMAEKRRQIEALEKELRQLDHGAYELHIAEMAFNAVEQRIMAYTARKEEARIDDVLDQQRIANVAMLSEPGVAEEAVYPPRLLIMTLGFISSLMLGFLIALIQEWREEKVFEQADLSTIEDLPFLGTFDLPDKKPSDK